MSFQPVTIPISGSCPVCCADISPAGSVEESEVLSCPECQSLLVVEGFEGCSLVLREGPSVEEDWGE
ncbi:MAG: hypothetical protein H6Q05_1796 [Acidobacteria bacterium]|jgi:lysine biosynthesis protein LysW|nr:hypothetical protein [Acidobacteriota bacterium]